MTKHSHHKRRHPASKRIKRTRPKKSRKKRTVKQKRINAKMLKELPPEVSKHMIKYLPTSDLKSLSHTGKFGRDETREELKRRKLFETTVRIKCTKRTQFGTETTYKNLTIDLEKMAKDIEKTYEKTPYKSERPDDTGLIKILDKYAGGNAQPYSDGGEYNDIDAPCRWTRKLWAMYYAARYKYFRKGYPEYKDMSLVDVYAYLLNDTSKTKEWFEDQGY